jgi:hypothetical protein
MGYPTKVQLINYICLVSHGCFFTEESPLEWVAPFRSHPLYAVPDVLLRIRSYRPPIYISRQGLGIPRSDADSRFVSKQMAPGTPTAQQAVFMARGNAQQAVCTGPCMPEDPHSGKVLSHMGVPA